MARSARRAERSTAETGREERESPPPVLVKVSGHALNLIRFTQAVQVPLLLGIPYFASGLDKTLARSGPVPALAGRLLAFAGWAAFLVLALAAWAARPYLIGVGENEITVGTRRRPAVLPRAHLESIEVLREGRMRLLVVRTAVNAPIVRRAADRHVPGLPGYVLCELHRESPETADALLGALKERFGAIFVPPESS